MQIAIVGGEPTSRFMAPFHNPDVQIWVTSPSNMNFIGPGQIERVDRWFEVHAVDAWIHEEPWWVEWLNKQSFDIYMDRENDFVPKAKAIPVARLVEKFGRYFFTSAMAWMMAMAIDELADLQGEKTIHLCGVDCAAGSEYEYQRPGVHFFMQVAGALKIKVITPPVSDIHRPPPLYGISWSDPMHRKLEARHKDFERRSEEHRNTLKKAMFDFAFCLGAKDRQGAEKAQAEIRKAERDLAFMMGASDDLGYIRRTWIGD